MTPEELKALQEEIKSLLSLLRKKAEEAESKGTAQSAEFKAFEAKLNERIDALEAKLNKPAIVETPEAQVSKEEAARKSAFAKLIRQGKAALTDAELKTLSIGDDTQAGYLAPKEFVLDIEKDLTVVSPMRLLAKRRQTSRKSIELPKRTGLVTAAWAVESEDISANASNSTYGLMELDLHKLTAISIATEEMLGDSAFNLEAEMRADFVEQFGATEGTAFISGDGVKKPFGVLTTGSGINSVTSATANVLAADDFINTLYGVKQFYRDRGSWLMHNDVIKAARKLKDSQNRYLWEPSMQAGQPASLLGRPVYEAPDMSNATTTTGAKVLLFGDFASGYTIADRTEVSLVRDNLTLAAKQQVRFIVHKRVGGRVTKGEALVQLVIG